MLTQSQNDPRWRSLKVGKTNKTLGQIGCFLTTLASILDRNPGDVLAFLNAHNCFDAQGELADTERVVKLLGFTSYAVVDHDPHQLSVVEVDYSPAPGIQTHFMVWTVEDHKVMNPWPYPAAIEVNEWRVVNWRVLGIPVKVSPAAEVFPAKPPEPDKPPQTDATAKYAELVRGDVLAGLKPQESLWQRIKDWFGRSIWPRATLVF